MGTAEELLAWSRSLNDERRTFAAFRARMRLIVAEINGILEEIGEPPTTLEELERNGIRIDVVNHDVPVQVEVEALS